MRMNLKPIAFVVIAALSLAACKDETAAPGSPQVAKARAAATPNATMQANIEALRAGDLKSVVLNSVPPSYLDHLRKKWKDDLNEEPLTDKDRAEFTEMMTKLTADGAEQQIWTEVEPKFKELEAQAAAQMPMWVGLGQGILASAVQQRQDLNEAQKLQATNSINAFADWARTAKFADAGLAQKSIGIVCDAARDMKLESLDQVRAMEFDQALEKGNIAFKATKDLLGNYGFSVDQILDSMQSEVLSEQGDNAKVKVSYQMLNTPLEFESELVRVDGQWYSKESVEHIKKELEGGDDAGRTDVGDYAAESDDKENG